jgi:hypothetical protein
VGAKDSGALRRELDEESRRQWMEFLLASPAPSAPSGPVLCIGHAQPLFEGTLPRLNQAGLVAPCCDTLHLRPAQMAEFLKRSLGTPIPDLRKEERRGPIRKLVAWINDRIEKPPQDDGFGGLAWAAKLKPLYTRNTP